MRAPGTFANLLLCIYWFRKQSLEAATRQESSYLQQQQQPI